MVSLCHGEDGTSSQGGVPTDRITFSEQIYVYVFSVEQNIYVSGLIHFLIDLLQISGKPDDRIVTDC